MISRHEANKKHVYKNTRPQGKNIPTEKEETEKVEKEMKLV